MKIVCEVKDKEYERLVRDKDIINDYFALIIANGTPLPKGHGRLIDADTLWDSYHSNDYDFYEALDDAPTIIEADKGESEE